MDTRKALALVEIFVAAFVLGAALGKYRDLCTPPPLALVDEPGPELEGDD